jgi:adenosyl cobinamide kinase/adenosyl cobinamide phosphate guanylyltransferase
MRAATTQACDYEVRERIDEHGHAARFNIAMTELPKYVAAPTVQKSKGSQQEAVLVRCEHFSDCATVA